jgi:hypothetical protein
MKKEVDVRFTVTVDVSDHGDEAKEERIAVQVARLATLLALNEHIRKNPGLLELGGISAAAVLPDSRESDERRRGAPERRIMP